MKKIINLPAIGDTIGNYRNDVILDGWDSKYVQEWSVELDGQKTKFRDSGEMCDKLLKLGLVVEIVGTNEATVPSIVVVLGYADLEKHDIGVSICDRIGGLKNKTTTYRDTYYTSEKGIRWYDPQQNWKAIHPELIDALDAAGVHYTTSEQIINIMKY